MAGDTEENKTSTFIQSRMTSTSNTNTNTNALFTASSIIRNATSSTAAAAVTATVVTPLDVVKVRLQAHVCTDGCQLVCQDPHCVTTSSEALRNIIRHDGFRGLWKGLNITLLLAIPTTGIYFTLYELFKQQYNHYNLYKNDILKNSLCGASARILAATLASPLELARTNIQAGKSHGVLDVLKQVRNKHGIKGWWNGIGPTLIRDAPFSAIYWSCYEAFKPPVYSYFKSFLHTNNHHTNNDLKINSIDIATYLTCGVGAGALAAVFTIPADVVKTRLQTAVATGNDSIHPSPHIKHTSRQVVKDIIETEGIKGLFKGTAPRVAKVAPACAIMMGSFELFKKLLGD